jgi:molecular chaperone GrpE
MNQKSNNSKNIPGDETEILDGESAPSADDIEDQVDGGETEIIADLSVEELAEKLEQARNEIDDMKDGYIRARAEVENVRRRSQNEIVSARKYAIEGFAQELLSVIDSLDQAARVDMSSSSNEAVVKMKEGLELTLKQLAKVMEKFGITAVEAASGVKFDPELHQAINVLPSNDVKPEHILSVMQTGFMLKDRLLRPAMVTIAKSPENK